MTDTRERLEGIKAELATYVGHRTHGLLSELIDIVAGLLPAEPASADEVELPVTFVDSQRDRVVVKRSGVSGAVLLDASALAVRIESSDVDRFVAAVLKAAGR